MKFYFVSADPIKIRTEKGELNLDQVTKEAIEASLGGKVKGKKRTVKFDGKNTAKVDVYASEEDAFTWARYGTDDNNPAQHVVLTLDSNIEDLEKFEKTNVGMEKTKKTLPTYSVPANQFTLLSASFRHVDKDLKDISYVAKSEKAAEASSSFLDLLKRMAPPVITAGAVGTGFWYAGGVPAAVLVAAKLGLALPAASLATQIAIPAAVGLATYAVGFAAWTLGKAVVNGVSNAWKKFNRTNKEKYKDDLKAEKAAIKDLEKQIGLGESDTFVVALDRLLSEAPKAQFNDKGAFIDEPKQDDRLALARWEHAQLKAAAAVKGDDDARNKIFNEMRKGPKPIAKP